MAQAWAKGRRGEEQAAKAGGFAATVRDAVAAYVSARKARHPEAGRDAELRLGRHVLGAALAEMRVLDLTENDFAAWRDGLRRGGRARNPRDAPLEPATVARLFNDFRACLGEAARKAKAPPEALAAIRDGLRAPHAPDSARPRQMLQDAEIRRLVKAAYAEDSDFGALVLVLAATGCRLNQAARLTVADYQADAARVMILVGRKGRGGAKTRAQIAVPLAEGDGRKLRKLCAGRAGREPLLLRWHHRQVPGDNRLGIAPRWERASRRPWGASSEMTRPWRAALEAARLPPDLVPYSLRHSSIVRALRAGLPVRLVAAAHDTSIGMIEKHYAAFIVDATEDLMRRSAVALAPADVVPLRVAGAENRPAGPVRQSVAAVRKLENKAAALPKMANPEGAKLTQDTRAKSRRK
jgi:integrase